MGDANTHPRVAFSLSSSPYLGYQTLITRHLPQALQPTRLFTMASEQGSIPVNGNYAPHQAQGYGAAEQNYATANINSAGYGSAQSPVAANANPSNSVSQIPKEEVAWYFVEKYYN